MSACCFKMSPLEGANAHNSSTLSRDLNGAERFVRGRAGLQQSSNCLSQSDQLVRFFSECADQNLSIYLQRRVTGINLCFLRTNTAKSCSSDPHSVLYQQYKMQIHF